MNLRRCDEVEGSDVLLDAIGHKDGAISS